MKILVLSDTHYYGNRSRCKELSTFIESCDKIFHLGDFISLEYYNSLKSTGKLLAVRGNNDFEIPSIKIEEDFIYNDFKIKLLHGHTENIDFLDYKFSDYNLILHGHIHHPYRSDRGSTIVASPGSVTSNRYVDYNSFMILTLDEKIDIEFVKTKS